MMSLPFGAPCICSASLSRTSLQSLSTRDGRLGSFSNVHSPQSSIFTHGSGGFGTLTCTVQLALSDRSSVAVPVTVMVLPASFLPAVTVAVVPVPLTWPPVEVQPYVIGRRSGLVAFIVTVALWPGSIIAGSTLQLTTGGRAGGGVFTTNVAEQVAAFIFLSLGSVIVELAM